ncbi:regulatory iron-sulfur-containing complex subunit RicT [uncultured Flavobacterium sp.]|uniref:PSP1 domain-containing protein n=1 Tax=uncultured Flavobacterium sp. TaxID=165435 RepID=UPI0025F50FF1|nr:regulatory iron-sulfur-containing complex subunit RicT [uncultured Flavobacterium sp.]
MACTSCSTSDGGAPKGCQNKGTCGTDSCNKLTVFDWLSNMSLPNGEAPFDCVEIRFKNGRKEFYRNTEKLTLSMGDIVATEASPGHDVGIVTLTGELVKIQMKKKGVNHKSNEIGKIYRKASQKDIDIWSEARAKEEPMKVRARELAIAQKLEMKISDIEFQGDGSKATFYYTANDRVDFRMLIKDFAKEFSTRIEMKQVGFRQEAARLGGIGSCGRELCCSTWLTDFRSVNTSAARYQQLSLNPQKLAGQCGKLKCCLNYELDTYMDALKSFPDFDTKLHTDAGDAICQKQDIFKGLMWFAYTNNFANWHVLKIDQVNEIIAENKQKRKVASLEDYALEEEKEPQQDFNNAMGQESLTRFDQPKKKKRPNKKRKPEGGETVGNGPAIQRPSGENRGQGQKIVPNKKPNPNQNPNANPQGKAPNTGQKPNPNQNANPQEKALNSGPKPNQNRNNNQKNRPPRPANDKKPDNKIIPVKKNEPEK